MAGNKTRKNVRRNQRRRENRFMMPVVKIPVPVDPPSFVQIPPWNRKLQLEYPAPSSGTTISPLVKDFFTASFGTDHHKTCLIKSVRIWSSSHEDKGATLVVSIGSPFGNTVPVFTYDDKAPVASCARVGFRLIGAYITPWSESASFCSIASDIYPVLIELTALFL